MKKFLSSATAFLLLFASVGNAAKSEEQRFALVETESGQLQIPKSVGLKGSPKLIDSAAMRKFGRRPIQRVPIPAGVDAATFVKTLQQQPGVVKVELDSLNQAIDVSDDPSYTNGSLWGMYSDDSPAAGPSGTTNQYGSQAEQAWAAGRTGSTRVVVGVIDTGIDYTHPDLYLNIWINPGEIKTLSFYNSLVDTDGDGLITFRDLNASANASRVTDFNSNGRIDAGDLLADSRWANGVDNDGNGYVDDLVGWNWVADNNNPMDDHYHGTHVAGTIGAIGGNGVGVAGVNWKVLLVPLKFLNSGGSGYSSDGALAVDYFTAATLAHDKAYNLSSPAVYLGTNNSWGGGSLLTALSNAISSGATVNNHFVAAAGNSSLNIVSSPFYPASYSTLSSAGWEAVMPVASITLSGSLSSFSNYGTPVVKVGAPGSGIHSTTPSNGYQSLNGTSMASPHVAGALALMSASIPQAGRRELSEVLLLTAKPTSALTGKVSTNGRLDIKAALAELDNRYTTPPPTVLWGTTRNDVITGTSGVDLIAGVPSSGVIPTALGKGQIDTLTGGDGNDVFRLGQKRGAFHYVFYNDGNPRSVGTSDRAILMDFNPANDKLRLAKGSYFTRVVGLDTFLYWSPGVGELIAVIKNQALGSISFSAANPPNWAVFD